MLLLRAAEKHPDTDIGLALDAVGRHVEMLLRVPRDREEWRFNEFNTSYYSFCGIMSQYIERILKVVDPDLLSQIEQKKPKGLSSYPIEPRSLELAGCEMRMPGFAEALMKEQRPALERAKRERDSGRLAKAKRLLLNRL